jgi:hypothetical protein
MNMHAAQLSDNAARIAQAACQRLLAASGTLTRLAEVGLLAGLLLLWLWAGWLAPRLSFGATLLLASLPAGLAALYYGFRVRLDADLFAILDQPGPVSDADFATGIARFRAQLASREGSPGGLGGLDCPECPLAPRFAGALRLWRRLAMALGLQLALLAGAGGAACLAGLAGWGGAA